MSKIFTTNLCINPSFQLGLQGYSAVNNAVIELDTSQFLYGNQSLLVTTPGVTAGEGVSTASGLVPTATLCSLSLYIQGMGTVIVSANQFPGSIVASTPVQLTSAWQRVIINQISSAPGQELNLIISTSTTLATSFHVSGVQIEPESPAHPYCDGDRVGCIWVSGTEGGISTQQFPNPVIGISNEISSSNIVPVLSQSQVSNINPSVSTEKNLVNLVQVTNAGPVAALSDFGVFQLTDPDPAQTYASWNTAGANTGTAGAYTRNYGVFIPPADYFVSGGQKLYSRAAYMALGWQFSNVLNNGTVNLTRVQAEILPVTTGYSQAGPAAYDLPREIHAIIKPTRLNYCTNPSIEVNTTGWTALGSATLSRDGTISAGNITEHDDIQYTAGTSSLKAVIHANSDGAQITLSNLIAGDLYMASAYVQAGEGLTNITMIVNDGITSVLSTGGTGYGEGGYGEGFYGGIQVGEDLAQSVFYRVNTIFTAPDSTATLQIVAATALDVVLPTNMWIDAVLVEPGTILGNYFDGNFGTNYSWEGTSGLSRSYYYDQQLVKSQAVLNVLAHHLPQGISFAAPLYSVPPTQ